MQENADERHTQIRRANSKHHMTPRPIKTDDMF